MFEILLGLVFAVSIQTVFAFVAANLAKGRGQPAWYGALLGALLGPLGLFMLQMQTQAQSQAPPDADVFAGRVCAACGRPLTRPPLCQYRLRG